MKVPVRLALVEFCAKRFVTFMIVERIDLSPWD